jgi:hypothetical protein
MKEGLATLVIAILCISLTLFSYIYSKQIVFVMGFVVSLLYFQKAFHLYRYHGGGKEL